MSLNRVSSRQINDRNLLLACFAHGNVPIGFQGAKSELNIFRGHRIRLVDKLSYIKAKLARNTKGTDQTAHIQNFAENDRNLLRHAKIIRRYKETRLIKHSMEKLCPTSR